MLEQGNSSHETEFQILGDDGESKEKARVPDLDEIEKTKMSHPEKVNERIRKLRVMFLLGIAYASNIGKLNFG